VYHVFKSEKTLLLAIYHAILKNAGRGKGLIGPKINYPSPPCFLLPEYWAIKVTCFPTTLSTTKAVFFSKLQHYLLTYLD
jgi:hypothetical protein